MFSHGFMRYAAKYEVSVDGNVWMTFFEGKFTKVKSSAK
jgi:hypothetical protein